MSKKQWILLAKAGIGLWVLAILVKKLDASAIADALATPQRPLYLVAATALLLPNLWVQWFRWHRLLKDAGLTVGARDSWASLMGGMPLGFVTPGRLGEAGRSLFIAHESRWLLVGLLLLDKLYAFGPILAGGAWGLAGVIAQRMGLDPFLGVPLLGVCLLVTAAVWAVAWHPGWIRSVLYAISLLFPYRDRFKEVIQAASLIKAPAGRRLGIRSLALYLIYMVQFVLLVQAFEPMAWGKALAAASATMLTKTLLPISLADLGVREGASVYFFGLFGAARVAAFNGALLLFSLNVLIPALVGLAYLPKMGIRVQE